MTRCTHCGGDDHGSNQCSDMPPPVTGDAAQSVQVPDGYILVPRELTAENGAKGALIGEFNEEFGCLDEDGEEQFANVPVTWTTIKAIHKKMVAHFDASQPPAAPCNAAGNRYPSDEEASWAINGAHDFAEKLRTKAETGEAFEMPDVLRGARKQAMETHASMLPSSSADNGELADLRRDVIELREWKAAIIGKCKASDGFDALEWGGDKEGWGFIHYFIGHLETRALQAEAQLRDAPQGAPDTPEQAETRAKRGFICNYTRGHCPRGCKAPCTYEVRDTDGKLIERTDLNATSPVSRPQHSTGD